MSKFLTGPQSSPWWTLCVERSRDVPDIDYQVSGCWKFRIILILTKDVPDIRFGYLFLTSYRVRTVKQSQILRLSRHEVPHFQSVCFKYTSCRRCSLFSHDPWFEIEVSKPQGSHPTSVIVFSDLSPWLFPDCKIKFPRLGKRFLIYNLWDFCNETVDRTQNGIISQEIWLNHHLMLTVF